MFPMKSGMLAAEAIIAAMEEESFSRETLSVYSDLFENSWLHAQLYEGRNFYQALSKTTLMKFIHLGAQYFTSGRGFGTTAQPEDRHPVTQAVGRRSDTWRPARESIPDL